MPSKIFVAFFWHALGACLLLLIGSLAIDAPFWVPGAGRRTLTILAMGYFATAVVSTTGLKEQDARWSERRLDAFLADPVGQVPGLSMRTGAVENYVERAAIIEHLKTLH